MYENLHFYFVLFDYYLSDSTKYWSWSFSLYDGPLILITEQWWSNLSSSTLVNVGSPKTSGHLENTGLVVMMVDVFSYLLDMRLKNRFAVSEHLLTGTIGESEYPYIFGDVI